MKDALLQEAGGDLACRERREELKEFELASILYEYLHTMLSRHGLVSEAASSGSLDCLLSVLEATVCYCRRTFGASEGQPSVEYGQGEQSQVGRNDLPSQSHN